MDQTLMTKHLRHIIKRDGIKARVRKLANSRNGIQIFPIAHDVRFTEDEQHQIRHMAKVNGLTLVRGLPIDVERMTDAKRAGIVGGVNTVKKMIKKGLPHSRLGHIHIKDGLTWLLRNNKE